MSTNVGSRSGVGIKQFEVFLGWFPTRGMATLEDVRIVEITFRGHDTIDFGLFDTPFGILKALYVTVRENGYFNSLSAKRYSCY